MQVNVIEVTGVAITQCDYIRQTKDAVVSVSKATNYSAIAIVADSARRETHS